MREGVNGWISINNSIKIELCIFNDTCSKNNDSYLFKCNYYIFDIVNNLDLFGSINSCEGCQCPSRCSGVLLWAAGVQYQSKLFLMVHFSYQRRFIVFKSFVRHWCSLTYSRLLSLLANSLHGQSRDGFYVEVGTMVWYRAIVHIDGYDGCT